MQNIGVDLTRISRFKNKNYPFAQRILSNEELEQFQELNEYEKVLFLARAWCIKEAIFKANNAYADYSKITLKKENNRWTFKQFSISISHEGDLLIAFVIDNGDKYEKNSL
ncbi:4'-phosphopantetheinyl transferase superfamily protein [Mycoplasmopsis columboralis]|uniref:Holo-[acyl-carrier protein]synthase n=1 Tax=Mycoplasmopsis columboralis TaxID=171282 RepID=A0A449B768_9BACT|nr:4'-phosphopantetheinyl transferase superfamily protein [Mycoplasmopsis columboralis]VEU76428.1 Holo-[acyl-carrier protein]synthase [Mycoplasmopsis columboralis]